MNWDPKLIVTEDYEPPFDIIQDGLDYLLKEADLKNYSAQAIGTFNAQSVTRYAVSQVTQHTDLQSISFQLTLVNGKRRASANSSLLGKDGLNRLFSQAEKGLRAVPEIPFYQGLPDPQNSNVEDFSGNEWNIEKRADKVIEAVNAAEEIDNTVLLAGTISSQLNYTHIMSTQGVDVENGVNSNYFKTNAILGPPEARGYGQEEGYWRYAEPEVAKLAQQATTTASDTLQLINLEPKEYEVLLANQAVANLTAYILFACEPVGHHEGNSYTSDRLGDQIFDEKITINDLPRDPRKANFVRNFDEEGVPTSNRKLYDKGTLMFIPYDSFTAAKYLDDKNAATGHNGGGWFDGPFLGSAVYEAGDKTLEQQISEMDDGLYVKNFWYNRFTIRREGGLTGLTRNGLYHVKNGEIQGAVRNLRYTESFVKAFQQNNVISVSNDTRMFRLSTCPSIHLKKYNFSSVAHTTE